MTPEARIAAAAGILDRYLAGEPAEKALVNWGRRSRFAGSGDRAAVRDLVFDAIRRRRSAAAAGAGESGRGLMIGLLRLSGRAPETLLTGVGHALPPLVDGEKRCSAPLTEAEGLDIPDWLSGDLRRDLGPGYRSALECLQTRANLFLRVHARRADRESVRLLLAQEDIEAEPCTGSDAALRVTGGGRRVRNSRLFLDGLIEIQDASSQAVCDMIPVPAEGVVLDLCAGGGGKSLALAARTGRPILAHDIDPNRMRDLPERARRAGDRINCIPTRELTGHAPFPLVVADVPCSGSGAWRRQPEAKWNLTPEALDRLIGTQRAILGQAAELTRTGGALAFVTCSLLRRENEAQMEWFLGQYPGWTEKTHRRIVPSADGDGFFVAILEKGN
ncbi:RsmB/NOP family class I SAM-dependent RNA methyltransferase [Tropicimonas sp.]|uniref:RsmB/NOP family class I SAM-dependent RNA methyltransferase n=1 Tax=Tropicimonas sp. TaxID=2067044 RepID=UPI003A8446CF